MKKFIVILFLIQNIHIAYSYVNGYTKSGFTIKKSSNSLKNIYETIITQKDAKYNFIELPKHYESRLSFLIQKKSNSEGIESRKETDINEASIFLQYTGIKNNVFGIKGSLNRNNFIEQKINEYNIYNNRFYNETDIGIKIYSENLLKPFKGFIIGTWNELVIDKMESNEPYMHESFDYTYTITPRMIYEKQLTKSIKTVTEFFMDFRKYNKRVIDIDGNDFNRFKKLCVTPHIIVNKRIDDKTYLKSYSNLSYERTYEAMNPVFMLRVAPDLKHKNRAVTAGVKGGGFEFYNEIGMNHDINELIALKKSGDYFSQVYSIKPYLKFEFLKHFHINSEAAYRYGVWKDRVNRGSLRNQEFKNSLNYSIKVNKNIHFNLNIFKSVNYFKFTPKNTIRIDETINGISMYGKINF